MGYNTTFKGVLKFGNEVTTKQLQKLSSFLGEDVRDHLEWQRYGEDLSYIEYRVAEDFSGLEWDESEKSYDMVEKLNLVITERRKEYPSFSLEGQLLAQGEDMDDRWLLRINALGVAEAQELIVTGRKVCCPHCDEEFRLEGDDT